MLLVLNRTFFNQDFLWPKFCLYPPPPKKNENPSDQTKLEDIYSDSFLAPAQLRPSLILIDITVQIKPQNQF